VVAGEDIVEVINPTLDADTELLQREVLTNSLVAAQPVLGKETSSGSFGLELSSMIGGYLNGDILYEAGMGRRIAPVASDAATATATVITVASSAAYNVGQALKTGVSDGDVEYTIIRSIYNNELTVSPALVNFAEVTSIEGLLSYTLARPNEDTISMSIEEYFESPTNQVAYTYSGVVVSDMKLSFPVAGIAKADFTIAGSGFSVDTSVSCRDAVCYDFSPYIAKSMTFMYDGTAYEAKSLDIAVGSTIYDSETITSSGISGKVATAKAPTGSFSIEYDGAALFAAYKAGTTGELYGLVSNATSTFGVYAPKVAITKSTKSVDSSIYMDNVELTMLSSNTCLTGVEDAITIFFG
jgi:hypothetical protein